MGGNSAVPTFEAVGCFKDNHVKPRPLPIHVANLRPSIDWLNPNKTIEECAKRTLNHPYLKLKYFGIQFYGECYSGVEGEKTYNRYGPSSNCVFGLGKDYANFVYRFVEKGKIYFSVLANLGLEAVSYYTEMRPFCTAHEYTDRVSFHQFTEIAKLYFDKKTKRDSVFRIEIR